MGWHAPPQTLKAQTARHKYVLANVHALPTPTAHPSADAYPAETSTAQGATHISTKPARGEAAAPIESKASIHAADALFLSDGRRLTLRQLGAADCDGLATLFARLSPESRRRRYLGTKTELTTVELARLTDIDHIHHEAIAAIDQCDGSIVGIARYVRDAGGADVAEVAIEVADAFQRMGIGSALASLTIQHAHANGLTSLTATTLWENRAARALLRHHGFRARRSRGREIEYELKLEESNIIPLAGRKLRIGSYRLTPTPTGASGGAGTARTTTFMSVK